MNKAELKDLSILLQKGLSLHRANRLQEAYSCYQTILSIDSNHFDALQLSATIHSQTGNHTAAILIYDQVLSIDKTSAAVFNNRGNSLKELKRFDDALASYEQALKIKPDYAEAFNNRGVVLKELKRFVDALASYEQALKIKPDYAEAFNNRGVALKELKRFDDALASYEQALKIKPDYADAYTNRGNALQEVKRFDDALASYEQALKINPNHAVAHFNSSLLHLLLGNFSDGWMLYEWRLKKDNTKHNYYSGHEVSWRGNEDIAGKRLLIHCEQGLGDSIQFARYLSKVLELGASVMFQVQGPLLSVFASMNLPVTLIAKGDPLPPFDAYCPLMSLPSVFKTTLETIPADIPYLCADPKKVSYWKEKIRKDERLKVGLVWNGGFRPNQPEVWSVNERRNIPLRLFSAFLQHPEVDFFSLQKGDPAESEILGKEHEFWAQGNFYNYADELNDFSDTAALIETLDLVISVDTSTAHLAGALGKPTWILNRYDTCWRWLEDREDSPWYPTVRLFRQDERRDWRSVLNKVKTALENLKQY